LQFTGQHISITERKNPYWNISAVYSIDHFVDGSIPTGYDNSVNGFIAVLPYIRFSFTRSPGKIGVEQKRMPPQNLDGIPEIMTNFSRLRVWIHNEK
jgi:hypothetical protein